MLLPQNTILIQIFSNRSRFTFFMFVFFATFLRVDLNYCLFFQISQREKYANTRLCMFLYSFFFCVIQFYSNFTTRSFCYSPFMSIVKTKTLFIVHSWFQGRANQCVFRIAWNQNYSPHELNFLSIFTISVVSYVKPLNFHEISCKDATEMNIIQLRMSFLIEKQKRTRPRYLFDELETWPKKLNQKFVQKVKREGSVNFHFPW